MIDDGAAFLQFVWSLPVANPWEGLGALPTPAPTFFLLTARIILAVKYFLVAISARFHKIILKYA